MKAAITALTLILGSTAIVGIMVPGSAYACGGPCGEPGKPSEPGPDKPSEPKPDKPGEPGSKPEKPGEPGPKPEKPSEPGPKPEKPGEPGSKPGKPSEPGPKPERPSDPPPQPERPTDPPSQPERPAPAPAPQPGGTPDDSRRSESDTLRMRPTAPAFAAPAFAAAPAAVAQPGRTMSAAVAATRGKMTAYSECRMLPDGSRYIVPRSNALREQAILECREDAW